MTNPDERERLRVPTEVASIALAREFVREQLGSVVPSTINDIVLVTSELVTNTIEHGSGDIVDVDTVVHQHEVVVGVTSNASSLPVPTSGHAPIADLAGRGLRIVTALSDDVAVIGAGSSVRVECRFRR